MVIAMTVFFICFILRFYFYLSENSELIIIVTYGEEVFYFNHLVLRFLLYIFWLFFFVLILDYIFLFKVAHFNPRDFGFTLEGLYFF